MASAAAAGASSASPLQSVRVVLRVRPLLPSEASSAAVPCVSLIGSRPGGEVTVQLKDQHTSRNECYKVDAYFSKEDLVSDIFDQEVSALIPGIFEGTNATVFAYGATGSGKTYTLQGSEDLPGLIPLSVSTILARCTGTWCSVDISYYEVYMERCYDLLEPKAKEIMALDDKEGNLQLKGLAWVPVRSMEEFQEVYSIGVQRRKVAHTGLNDFSSRSHAVLSIRVCNDSVKGKLNLIDLAGNEDNRKTCNEGIRLLESSKINSSLFALSNVISALKKNEQRIPYRESKLTRILQDSLGGNSRAVMIACLNPVEYQEAAHTLSLAARSGHMVTNLSSASKEQTPKVKVDMEAKLQVWLESKGKTKSIQRMNGLFSPTGCKTPSSMSHMKQPASARLSSRAKAMDRDGGKIKKVLFDSSVNTPAKNKPRPSSRDEVKTIKKVVPPSLPPCIEDKSESPIRKALSPISSNLMALKQQTADDVNCPSLPPCIEDKSESPIRKALSPFSSNLMALKQQTADDVNCPSLPPCIEDKSESPIRKALSPISSNLMALKQQTADDVNCPPSLEPKTPIGACHIVEKIPVGTPLDKFNALGSNLKESLIQQYLEFLNVANKEELQQLKGIGEKRAEYILELREDSPRPFKSLSDLGNIGLSSKQIQDILRKTATGIFK